MILQRMKWFLGRIENLTNFPSMDNFSVLNGKIINTLILMVLVCLNKGYSQNSEKTQPLFDGKDLRHWVMHGDDPGFVVKDGLIVSTVQNGDNLFTKEVYGNYKLTLDYFLSEVGNSGVLIRCDPEDAWTSGVEVQLLAPWTPYRDDLHCTASLYGHVAVTDRPDETTGVWHRMEILCDRKFIRIFVDGKMATEVNIDTVESMQDKFLEGVIGLQSNHGEPTEFVHFRNIHIENFDADPEYVLKGFSDVDSRVRLQAHGAALRLGDEMIPFLIPELSSEIPEMESGAKQVLLDLVAEVTRPGYEKEKKRTKKTLKKHKKKAASKMARQYLDELLRLM